MTQPSTVQLIEAVVGSTRVFSKAVNSVVEDEILPEAGESRLTRVQLTALKLIDQYGSQTLGELAGLLDVSSAAACKLVDRLVRRSLIKRAEGKSDRRLTQLILTPFGRDVLHQYESRKTDMLARTFESFSPDDLAKTVRVLEKLSAALIRNSNRSEEICLQCYMHGDTCSVRKAIPEECRSLKRRLRNRDLTRVKEVSA
ncbi:MAG: MarR family transcriptional regulator [Acidobacteriales bacterium]|nr:MarR family transcriptional regulator [Terriglobales bacterium]